jgi:hypothetical protein
MGWSSETVTEEYVAEANGKTANAESEEDQVEHDGPCSINEGFKITTAA